MTRGILYIFFTFHKILMLFIFVSNTFRRKKCVYKDKKKVKKNFFAKVINKLKVII